MGEPGAVKRTFQFLGKLRHPGSLFELSRRKLLEMDNPRAERMPAPALTASYETGSSIPLKNVKNISSSGIYLYTEKRLRTGELITLILQEEGDPKEGADPRVSIQARVARHGEDGMGLSFVLPPGMDLGIWEIFIRSIAVCTDPEEIPRLFQTLRAILFLTRICPSETEEAILLVCAQLDPDLNKTAVKIAIAAEQRLAGAPDADRVRIHPKLLAKILRNGSWRPEDEDIHLWAGLLASSCSVDELDDGNQVLADLLVHLGPRHAGLFLYGCERTLAAAPDAKAAAQPIVLTPGEMCKLADVIDPYRVAPDVAHLFNLGLLKTLFDFTSYRDVECFDLTPSSLGLELFKRCHGCRDKLDQHFAETAKEHLVNFAPPAPPDFIDLQTLPWKAEP